MTLHGGIWLVSRGGKLEGFFMFELPFHYQGYLSDLGNFVVGLANVMEEYKVIQSIPGIGGKIAAKIIPKMGEIGCLHWSGSKRSLIG
jgi:hypothetical protein